MNLIARREEMINASDWHSYPAVGEWHFLILPTMLCVEAPYRAVPAEITAVQHSEGNVTMKADPSVLSLDYEVPETARQHIEQLLKEPRTVEWHTYESELHLLREDEVRSLPTIRSRREDITLADG